MPYVVTTRTPASPARSTARHRLPHRPAGPRCTTPARPTLGGRPASGAAVSARRPSSDDPHGERGGRASPARRTRPASTGVVPASTHRVSTWRPATYCTGRATSHWPGPPSRSSVADADARIAPAREQHVLAARPVDPEVRTTSGAGSADSSHRASSPCTCRARAGTGRRPARIRSSTAQRTCGAGRPGRTAGAPRPWGRGCQTVAAMATIRAVDRGCAAAHPAASTSHR